MTRFYGLQATGLENGKGHGKEAIETKYACLSSQYDGSDGRNIAKIIWFITRD